MTSSEYKNTIEWTLSVQTQENEDTLTTAKRILTNLGVPFPHGTLEEAVQILSSRNYMGWNPCNAAQAKYCANHGYTAIGVTNNRVVIILPEDEAVTVDNALPKVSHPAARKLSELQEKETAEMQYFVYAILLEDLETAQGNNVVMAAATTTTCTNCQSGNTCNTCQKICQTGQNTCNACLTVCQSGQNTCNACQTNCQNCQGTCQSGNTPQPIHPKVTLINPSADRTEALKNNHTILISASGVNCSNIKIYINGVLSYTANGNSLLYTYHVSSVGVYRIYAIGTSSTGNTASSATYTVNVKSDPSKIYTVTYNYNGGSGSPKEDFVPIGTSIVLPTPTRSGYLFKGWFQSLTGSTMVGNAGSRYTPKNSITLYALWKKTYKIRFDANGGKETYNPEIVEDGASVILPEPTREHYDLVGWYKRISSDTGTITRITVGKAGDEYTPNESCTLYASWKEKLYTVTFDVNGGNTSISQVQKAYGTKINLPTPTRTGYRFDGWYNGTKKVSNPYEITSNVTLCAHWSEWTIDTLLDRFESAPYVPDSSKDSPKKRETLLRIGRAMASWNIFPAAFIIGMLGHITSEGNIGFFEGCYSNIENDQGYMKKTREKYPNYPTDYSNQYIYNETEPMRISTVKSMVEELQKLGDGVAGFGLGCCQWTFNRTLELLKVYATKTNGLSSFEQAVSAESEHMYNELTDKTKYKMVYSKWKDDCGNNLYSAEAAKKAGRYILLGYGGNLSAIDNPPSGWIGMADKRGQNAELLFNYLTNWNTD